VELKHCYPIEIGKDSHRFERASRLDQARQHDAGADRALCAHILVARMLPEFCSTRCGLLHRSVEP
jgi:hypothetical protein